MVPLRHAMADGLRYCRAGATGVLNYASAIV